MCVWVIEVLLVQAVGRGAEGCELGGFVSAEDKKNHLLCAESEEGELKKHCADFCAGSVLLLHTVCYYNSVINYYYIIINVLLHY